MRCLGPIREHNAPALRPFAITTACASSTHSSRWHVPRSHTFSVREAASAGKTVTVCGSSSPVLLPPDQEAVQFLQAAACVEGLQQGGGGQRPDMVGGPGRERVEQQRLGRGQAVECHDVEVLRQDPDRALRPDSGCRTRPGKHQRPGEGPDRLASVEVTAGEDLAQRSDRGRGGALRLSLHRILPAAAGCSTAAVPHPHPPAAAVGSAM